MPELMHRDVERHAGENLDPKKVVQKQLFLKR